MMNRFILLAVFVVYVTASCVSFTANFEKPKTDWDHYWERCVGSGHAVLGLREDWRSHLRKAHDELGFQSVRFHGLFDDDMSVMLGSTYSWFNVDSLFDFLLSIGMKPLVELSFMPEHIASGTTTIMHYKGNTTPPKTMVMWGDLISNFAKHLVERYGIDEVSTWHFETWNEPNCNFFTGSQETYFELLKTTSAAIKGVDTRLKVGGPATCQSGWINETLAYAKKNNVSLDFISTHEYPTDISPLKRGILKQVMTSVRKTVGDMPLYYTETNDGLFHRHDTTYASSFAVFNMIDIYGIVDILSWWTFTDVFEEGGMISVPFHQGFGLQNIYSIPKPAYRAFQLLHMTGDKRVDVSGSDDTAGVLVTTNATHVITLLYNHDIPTAPMNTKTICISMENIAKTAVQASLMRIDEQNANAYNKWISMGKPEYPTPLQNQEMMSSSEFTPKVITSSSPVDNTIQFQVDVPLHGVAAIVFPIP